MSEGPPYNDMPYMDLPLDLLEQIEKTPVKARRCEGPGKSKRPLRLFING